MVGVHSGAIVRKHLLAAIPIFNSTLANFTQEAAYSGVQFTVESHDSRTASS